MDQYNTILDECNKFITPDTLYNKLCKISNIATLCNNFIKLYELSDNVPYFDTYMCNIIINELINNKNNVINYVIRLELYIIQLFQCNTEKILIDKYKYICKMIKHIPIIINKIINIYNL